MRLSNNRKLDPNPLSVIEALWAGLPLILSNRVGNQHEALVIGKNGWLFDQQSGDAVREVLEKWTALTETELQLQCRASALIAEKSFRTETVVSNFLDQFWTRTP